MILPPRTRRLVVLNAGPASSSKPHAIAAWLRGLKPVRGPLIAVLCELDDRLLRDALRRIPRARLICGDTTPGLIPLAGRPRVTHGSREVGILVIGRSVRIERARVRQLTGHLEHPDPHPLLWHDRWAIEVVYRWRGRRYTTVSLHANAGIVDPASGDWLHNPGALAWRAAMDGPVADLIRTRDRAGHTVDVAGDLNAWDRGSANPRRWATSQRLPVRARAVNRVMWHLSTEAPTHARVLTVPTGLLGVDHPGALMVDYRHRSPR